MKLQKRIYTNRESNKLIDRSFKEIGSKLEGISVNDFFNIYENLFLDIHKHRRANCGIFLLSIRHLYLNFLLFCIF